MNTYLDISTFKEFPEKREGETEKLLLSDFPKTRKWKSLFEEEKIEIGRYFPPFFLTLS